MGKYLYCPVCGTEHIDYMPNCIKCGSSHKQVLSYNDSEYYIGKSKRLYGDASHARELLIKEEVSIGRLFDESEYLRKETREESKRKMLDWINSSAESSTNSAHSPKCPTCGSYNVKRISHRRRAAYAMTIGLLSTTARSQFECLSCSYKW